MDLSKDIICLEVFFSDKSGRAKNAWGSIRKYLEESCQQYGEAPVQQPQPAMCLGCEYWRNPSSGHCIRGEGTDFCFKVGTHAGVR